MKLLKVEEVAELFSVKPHTVRNWIKRGQIPKEAIFKIGATVRVKKEILEEFVFKTAI